MKPCEVALVGTLGCVALYFIAKLIAHFLPDDDEETD